MPSVDDAALTPLVTGQVPEQQTGKVLLNGEKNDRSIGNFCSDIKIQQHTAMESLKNIKDIAVS